MDIQLKNQPLDLTFAPQNNVVYTGLMTGEVKAFSFEDDGQHSETFSIRPTKRSCRGLALDSGGTRLFTVSKDKTLHTIDPLLGKITDAKLNAHESSINRVTMCMPQMVATGDDDGVVKLWDPRKPKEIRSYNHHFDFISDLLWMDDKKLLLATSGDGSLSVMDVRSSKTTPLVQSEDQEDELLSATLIKNNTKLVIGTQLGILSIFNRSAGYGDCVDRVPGHPHSIDALAALTDDVVATGSSDGLIRLVQILPSKLLGVIGDHGEFPVERIKINQNKTWLGSVSHDEVVKLIDVRDILEDSDDEDEDADADSKEDKDDSIGADGQANDDDSSDDDDDEEAEEPPTKTSSQPLEIVSTSPARLPSPKPTPIPTTTQTSQDPDSDDADSDDPKPLKRRKTKDPNVMSKEMSKQAKQRQKDKRKGKVNTIQGGTFFDGLS